MADQKRPVRDEGQQELPVPQEMFDQAQAAVAGEHDTSATSAAERRHMGEDVELPHLQASRTTRAEDDLPPPAYGEKYGTIHQEQDGFGTSASVTDDGRVNIRIDQRTQSLSQLLVPSLKQLQQAAQDEGPPPPAYIPPSLGGAEGVAPPPPMNIVIQVVGSRGDVQPFVALGKVLKDTYGHRVRLATHPNFNDFVNENGLEFFNIGGDPQALMAFMVKNPGLMPGFDSLRAGDVGSRRKEVGEYLQGCWRSCFETGDGTGMAATDTSIEDWTTQGPGRRDHLHKPFVADCIIANPPSFAHIHCAEKLGIPLHIMFTMPYSPTQAFPHPLANIQSSNADANLTNYISYALIDMLTWQGLGDIINRWRQRSLGLETISFTSGPGILQRLKIPHTYCWSPALIAKPKDWGTNVNISGFFFLDLASNYTPEPDLQAFLDAGPPPVYIGFGSIVLDDPTAMTKLIFDAVQKSGQRALVSKGWGGVGADELGKPDNVFMLGNVPHDWLFKHVSCVVHHGGAGTTAAGITAGRPTLVVPFFGDQPFWGSMVARAGAGPDPIPNKQLTAENLAEGIMKCLEPQSLERASELAASIATERGSDLGAQSFHQFLDVDKMRCSLAPSRPAVWRIKRTQARLSAMAACTLSQEGLLDFNTLKLFRAKDYEVDDGPWDPITGGATALVGTMSTMMLGVADLPVQTLKALKIHPDATKKKSKDKQADGGEGPAKSGDTGSADAMSIDSKDSSRSMSDATLTGSEQVASPGSSRTTSSFNFQDSLAKLNAGPLSPGSESSAHRSSSTSAGNESSGQPAPSKKKSFNAKEMFDQASGTGEGVSRVIGAGLKSPMDFTLGLAKGFHNAPKLYGDDTVRKSEKVTDLRTGIRAATREFGFGMYDGISGLVTQPMKGAQKDGAAGFFKGIGKGIGGLVLKPGAAIYGIPGYTMQGVYKEIQKQFGSTVQNYIISARTAQGFDDYQKSSLEERQDVIMRWTVLQNDLKKKRNPDELVKDILGEQMRKKEAWLGTRQARDEKAPIRSGTAGVTVGVEARPQPSTPGQVHISLDRETAEQFAINEAIRQSVLQTSEGDAVKDAEVEQGIRESMAEVQRNRAARGEHQDDSELQKAMEESAAEAERHDRERQLYDTELERALAHSLREQRGWGSDVSDVETGPSFSVQRPSEQPPAYDPGHIAGTTKEEFERQQGCPQGAATGAKTRQEKTEEEIVLEYVKKQSLLEQQAREKVGAGRAPLAEEDDDELQEALKISMQDNSGSR